LYPELIGNPPPQNRDTTFEPAERAEIFRQTSSFAELAPETGTPSPLSDLQIRSSPKNSAGIDYPEAKGVPSFAAGSAPMNFPHLKNRFFPAKPAPTGQFRSISTLKELFGFGRGRSPLRKLSAKNENGSWVQFRKT